MLHHLCFSDNWFFCFLLFSLTNICVKLFAENSDIDKNPEKGQESIKSAVYTSNEQKLLDKELDTLIYCKRKLGRWNLNNWTFFCMLDANHRLNWWNAPSISYKVHLNGSITNPFFFAHTLESEEWFSALNMRSHEQISYPVERIYRVSQQVWDMLNVPFWSSEKFASEASYFYKIWPIKKGEILNFDPVTSRKLLIYPF